MNNYAILVVLGAGMVVTVKHELNKNSMTDNFKIKSKLMCNDTFKTNISSSPLWSSPEKKNPKLKHIIYSRN